MTSLRHSMSQYRNVEALRTWHWYYIPTKLPTALSASLYIKRIYSEWSKKRWVRGDATSRWNHVFSLRRDRRFRATCCQHLSYESSFKHTPVLSNRGRTFSSPHYHNTSRTSFVGSNLHQHYDARRHSWASVPCCANPPPPLNHYGKFYARKHKDSNPPAPPTNLCFLPHRQHALNYICNPSGTQNLKFIRNNMAKSYFFLSISVCPSLPNHCRCKGWLLHLITFNDTRTFGRTPLGEGSATSRDLYLTTHNIHKRETPTLPAGFEPAVPASDRPQTYNLDRRAKQTSGKWNTQFYVAIHIYGAETTITFVFINRTHPSALTATSGFFNNSCAGTI